MRIIPLILSIFFCINYLNISAQNTIWEIDSMATMPEKVSNNAVCEGFIGNNPYVYSFAGIDSTKNWDGIHLKAWRYDLMTDSWDTIPPLPDNMGKIAAGASRIADTIYIIGGYHVFSNGSEVSSNKVHRFNTQSNSYLPDAADLPVATDDHVQCVWRDSLIYVITGWSNSGNISNVQIYDAVTNTWISGTSVPNSNIYRSFGASGTIVGDTIYYFGGASMGFNFPIQSYMRRGVINPDTPYLINWTDTILDNSLNGYRMASVAAFGRIFWLGGSGRTYNYDGLAYSNNTAVSPLGRSLYYNPGNQEWATEMGYDFPMDLRGLGHINDSLLYIIGGMQSGPTVSNKTLRIRLRNNQLFSTIPSVEDRALESPVVYPNPNSGTFSVALPKGQNKASYTVYDMQGRLLQSGLLNQRTEELTLTTVSTGFYLLYIEADNYKWSKAIYIK